MTVTRDSRVFVGEADDGSVSVVWRLTDGDNAHSEFVLSDEEALACAAALRLPNCRGLRLQGWLAVLDPATLEALADGLERAVKLARTKRRAAATPEADR